MVRFWHLVHCIGVLLVALPGLSAAQPQPVTRQGTGYTVFLRGTPLGREVITISQDADGTTVSAQGRLAAPLDVTVRVAEFKYRTDWSPTSFRLDATAGGRTAVLRTTFADNTASTESTEAGQSVSTAHAVAPRTIIHVNGIFGSYVALARRLLDAEEGADFRVYVVPQTEISARVKAVQRDRLQIGTIFLDVRQYELVYSNPGGELTTNVTVADDGSLIRVSVPAQGLDIMREDAASSTTRTRVYSNPGDEAVIIPATGFSLGATLTRPEGPVPTSGVARAPAGARAARLPAVVLLSGSGAGDRDGFAVGVPTLGHLAGAIARAGMLAVRYDKRGIGQSGGRAESATLSDYAEDARTVVRWLERRPDVDPKRIAVVGHSEGAWVALLAASRENRIAAVTSIAGPATTGADLVLEQQRHALDRANLSPEERSKRVELQKQIQSAVLTGKGWDTVPADLRKTADTPWFQSLLAFDPAKVVDGVRQPILFVHGALDRQVPVEHAERLADLARKESKSKSIELVIVRGVNHLLVPATTGEVDEYGTLPDRNVSQDVTTAVSDWLTKTFAAVR